VKYTLLEMTQMILSSLDGDEVNTISDTVEAAQVATIIKNTYFDIVSSLELPEHDDLFELTATTSDTPTVMTKPSDVTDIKWVKYDYYTTADPLHNFMDVFYLDLHEFLTRQYRLNPSDDNVETCNLTTRSSDSLVLNYRNDAHPKYYTTFDDNTVLFDSYDSDEDAFLQKTKTQCFGSIIPGWTHSDAFTPDLDAKQFTLLLNEAKGQAFVELKQAANPKAEKRARRGWIQAQRTKNNIVKKTNYSGYGRK
jgi:hypothetical protein